MSVEQIAADQTYTSVHKIINDRDEDVINFEQFEQLIKEFPDIVFPAFRLRHKLYKKVFGVKFWDRVSKATITLADGRTMSVAEMKLSIKSCCRSCGVAAEVERFHGIQHTHPQQHTQPT
jgi:hypothetical protein